MNDPAPGEVYALLVVEFDVSVDKVSRAMFAGKMVELGWMAGGVANSWILEFEPRSRSTMRDTVRQHVEMATYSARIEAGGVKAVAQFGDEEPAHVD